jgi:nucleoside-diphosphate-sugar epimerase
VAREQRLSSVVVRYFFPYGPGQRAGIVPRLATTIASGRPVTLYQRGRVPHINPVFVADAADLTQRALSASTTLTVNCAGGDIVTVRELSQRIAAILGVRATFVPGRDPSVGDMVASLTQSARALGFKPRMSLDAGLERTLKVIA